MDKTLSNRYKRKSDVPSLLLRIFWSFIILYPCVNAMRQRPRDAYGTRECNNLKAPSFDGTPVEVLVSLDILDIDEINEEKMEFRLHLYLLDMWKDPTLRALPGHTDILSPENTRCIWTPDLIFPNSKSGSIFPVSMPNSVVKLLQDGYFHRSTRYQLQVGCRMDLRLFPMDTQVCEFQIGLMANDDSRALLRWNEAHGFHNKSFKQMKDTQKIKISPLQFQVLTTGTHSQTEEWPSGNYTILVSTFIFKRRLMGILLNTYVPSGLVVVLCWLSFWLDVDAVPARVTMGVTSLLTLSTQVIQGQYYLPPVDYATSLDIWLLGCMVMVFGSLVEYSFAYQHAKRQLKVPSKQADTEQAWNIKPSIPNLDVIESGSDYNTTQSSLDSKSFRNKSYEKSKSGTLDRVSRVVFPFIFSSFVTVYWGYFLTKVEVDFSLPNTSFSNVKW